MKLVLARDTTVQGASEEGAAPDSRCRCQTVHVSKRRAVAGAGVIGEQVSEASELLVEATIIAVLFCCYM